MGDGHFEGSKLSQLGNEIQNKKGAESGLLGTPYPERYNSLRAGAGERGE